MLIWQSTGTPLVAAIYQASVSADVPKARGVYLFKPSRSVYDANFHLCSAHPPWKDACRDVQSP